MRFLGFFRGLAKKGENGEILFTIWAEPDLKGHKDTAVSNNSFLPVYRDSIPRARKSFIKK